MAEEESNNEAAILVPSQVQKKSRRRRPNNRKKPSKPSSNTNESSDAKEGSKPEDDQKKQKKNNNRNNTNESADAKNEGKSDDNQKKPKKSNNRNKKKKPDSSKENNETKDTSSNQTANKTKKRSRNRNRNKNNERFPWRNQLPLDAVDPISLEPLKQNTYPPFALMISPPYNVIPEWPIPKNGNSVDSNNKSLDPIKREKEVLSEQWGDIIPQDKQADEANTETDATNNNVEVTKYFHLFDGRVLAVYLVSTLQFIDPLNRRDLTRAEIKNLDDYLIKHRLKKMRVLEAYDEKGISVSTASSTAQTASGRLQMRQEEARNLMNSLFGGATGGGSNSRQISNRRSNVNNAMAQQYAAHQSRERQAHQNAFDNSNQHDIGAQWGESSGIHADDEGNFMIIDDNMNPGLRGGLNVPVVDNTRRSSGPAPRSSNTQQMASWYGHEARVRADNFPSLSATVPSSSSSQASETHPKSKPSKPAPVSKSLSKIGNLVQKVNPKQLEKRRKARELAMRKAEMASLPYEEALKLSQAGVTGNNIGEGGPSGLLSVPQAAPSIVPTSGQIERNRNLAAALGVAPSTVRLNPNAGWKRPVTSKPSFDEFGNELNATVYPDALIIEAKERMMDVYRVEKKWLSFLNDDKSASCNLKPMDKPARKFVHEYSDFWNLTTQSFDPAPKRYIYCTKTIDTHAPRPLLSEAVQKWKGPTEPTVIPKEEMNEEKKSASEEKCEDTEFDTDALDHVQIQQKIANDAAAAPLGAIFDLEHGALQKLSISDDVQPPGRFAFAEKDRPKLNLNPRTKPLELPKYEAPTSLKASDMEKSYEQSRSEIMRKKKEEETRKKEILAAAFASDDEDSDSEWEEEEALVTGSDEE
ncbi:hypothetical protein CTEN210_17519 [Chaetoceros tenuissimus]|uniref:R3H domain-containing protein n=1 Tax=Chaetoceros tenuissimus TaxID=426638 RepID=A0AAD3DAW6_9STRA|nr:hypothetical protein CTEN210_17519 [Chaetoceros tenuissimus]